MQTILDGIMGSVLRQIAWRLLLRFAGGFLIGWFGYGYILRHIHIYWK